MRSNNRMMAFLLVASMGVSLVACGQNKSNHDGHKPTEAENTDKEKYSSSISKEQAQKILSAYLKLKDNLVKTNGPGASESAKAFLAILNSSKDELMKELAFDAEHIMNTQNAGHQRDHFNTLSDNVYKLVKSTSANEQTIYRQYCPMAFNNEGAYWLSAEKEVNNPYFGDKMLHCGSVKEEL